MAGRPVDGPPFASRTGGDLLSRALAGQVPSARRGLTALFGMGRGVSPSLVPPRMVSDQAPRRAFKTAQLALGITFCFARRRGREVIRQALEALVPVC